VTAVTFLDRKWPRLRRDDDVLLRAHVGRSDDARWSEMGDDELSARVSDELAVLLAQWGEPSESLVKRWPLGLPQYRVGHEQLVTRARAAGGRHSVALAGNAYDGVGVPASIGSGRRAARQLWDLRGGGKTAND
jgi:oxygen-dependent protoporphyrinogen oxidase